MSILTKLRSWGWALVGLVASFFGAYMYGRKAAQKAALLKQLNQTTKTNKQVRKVKDALNAMDDTSLRKRSKRWLRK